MKIKYHQFKGNRMKRQFNSYTVARGDKTFWFTIYKDGTTGWALSPDNFYSIENMKSARSLKAIKRQLRKALQRGELQKGDHVYCCSRYVGYDVEITL